MAAQVRADEARYLWLRDAAGAIVFNLPVVGAPKNAERLFGGQVEVIGGAEALAAMRLLLGLAGARKLQQFERALTAAAKLQSGRLARATETLESALEAWLQSPAPGLEEASRLVWAWTQVVVLVEGKEALYRRYERRIKEDLALEMLAQAELAKYANSLRQLVARIKRLIRVAKAVLRRARREHLPYAEARVFLQKPVAKPAVNTAPVKAQETPAVEQAEPAVKREKKASRVKELREKLQKRLAEKKQREARKRAAEIHRLKKAAIKAALRRKRAKALLHVKMQEVAPLLHAALVEAVRWGALRDRDVAEKVLLALRGKEHSMAAIAAAIDALKLHEAVQRLISAYDDAEDFAAVVRSASDGGRDAERLILDALRQRGVEVHVSREADRKAGVDAFVIVDGVGVCLQLTTMSWWSATTPTKAAAAKRLVNGSLEVGEAVSKVQKDLEKFRRHYGELPYLIVGVNVRMPFTPEQYADDVLRLLKRQASEGGGARVAFIAAPGFVAFEEVQP
ncbi:MAG: hypothetical protein RMK15_04545 [Chloroflexota bacterium]|nr:hypothetical protein [Chloroflexota bacterium]